MGLTGLYYAGEDKWYKLLDKIDEHIPIYKVIEPIDKAVPSFALFLVGVALIIVLGVFALLSLPAGSVFSIQVLDEDENPLANATVTAFVEGAEVFFDTTNESGEIGPRAFPLETVLEIVVSKEGYEEYSETYTLDKPSVKKKVFLSEIRAREVTILLKDEYN